MRLRISIILSFFALLLLACGNEKPVSTAAVEVEPAGTVKANIAQKKAELEAKNVARDSILLTQSTENRTDAQEITAEKPVEKPVEKPKATAVKKKKPTKRKPTKKKLPGVMTFMQPVFNYGKIEQGDVVMHEFTFVNTGESALVINDIRASCGCTQPTYPFLPIAPGDKGVIGVKFDSKGKLGKMKPMVTITTNAEPAIIKIFLEGFVDAPSKESTKPAQDSSLIQ